MEYKIDLVERKQLEGKTYFNLVLTFNNNCKFELVPHTRTKRESAYFYALLLDNNRK